MPGGKPEDGRCAGGDAITTVRSIAEAVEQYGMGVGLVGRGGLVLQR